MILDRLREIISRVRAAAERAGRDPAAVQLVAVTKYATAAQAAELIRTGLVSQIGENKVQEAMAKRLALGDLASKVSWRLIGHLQTNKARQAGELFDAVDSVDSVKVAAALDGALADSGRRLPVLAQVKLSGKETQHGTRPEDLPGLLKALEGFRSLEVRGLMALAPELEPVEAVRPHFRMMRRLFEDLFAGKDGATLSMGMSRDFELAVEEGATQVRVGSSIFSRTTAVRNASREGEP